MPASSSEPLLYLVGRDAWQKDAALNALLVERLQRDGFDVRWEDPAAGIVHRWRRLERRLPRLPGWLRGAIPGLIQLTYALGHPAYLAYLRCRLDHTPNGRARWLKNSIRRLGAARTIVLARSAGGRAASLVADELGLKHIVCLGYPFRHPERGDEPARYGHLAELRTPMLIVQGSRDQYGGRGIEAQYRLAPGIELEFLDTDHDFAIDARQADLIVERIETIAGHPPGPG